jgi:transcriptional regulator with XRE-family HTH domain
MGGTGNAPESPTVIAERLDYLLATVHPPGRGPYLQREVVEGVNAAAGKAILSKAYLSQLRSGQRAKPSFEILKALARFFGVPEAYFSDDLTADRIDEQIAVLQAIRDDGVRAITLRAHGLSGDALDAVKAIIDNVRRTEHLPPAGQPPAPGKGG